MTLASLIAASASIHLDPEFGEAEQVTRNPLGVTADAETVNAIVDRTNLDGLVEAVPHGDEISRKIRLTVATAQTIDDRDTFTIDTELWKVQGTDVSAQGLKVVQLWHVSELRGRMMQRR